jgi:plasmid stabilization system protein ParE
MRLRYTAEALDHLSSIRDYLTKRGPAVARRILRDIRSAAVRLCEYPQLGHTGPWSDTRIWVVQRTPYLIVYRSDPQRDEVVVLGVFHGRQDWGLREP